MQNEVYSRSDQCLARVDRLQERSHGEIFTKNPTRIVDRRRKISCRREERKACSSEVNLPKAEIVSPCSDASDKQHAGRGDETSRDEGILTLDVDGEALEEEMERELEDQVEQNAERARTIFDTRQPSKRESVVHAGAWHV